MGLRSEEKKKSKDEKILFQNQERQHEHVQVRIQAGCLHQRTGQVAQPGTGASHIATVYNTLAPPLHCGQHWNYSLPEHAGQLHTIVTKDTASILRCRDPS